jgi:hypothetical protein
VSGAGQGRFYVLCGCLGEEMKRLCVEDRDDIERKRNVVGSNFVDVSSCLGN